MVLLVLALIWGALAVSWLRSRSTSTFSDSVGTFRRHLTVLERTSPTTVAPANRLRGINPGRTTPSVGLNRRPVQMGVSIPMRTMPMAANSAALRRRAAQKRRRDVFFALLAAATGSLALALLVGISIMWPVQIVCDLLLGGYVMLLVRIRNVAAERELKLRFIPADRPVARARRSYDFGAAGYGDLDFRRAAN